MVGIVYLTMIILPVEDTKFLFYNGVEVKGLYLQNDEYPFKDLDNNDSVISMAHIKWIIKRERTVNLVFKYLYLKRDNNKEMNEALFDVNLMI